MKPPGNVILVVEDNPITRKMVRVALSTEDYHTLEAGDGRTALEVVRRADPRPDLILLDLILPDVNGFDLLRTLRQDADMLDIPIIAFSGLLSASEEAQVVTAGFDGLLIKPVEPSRMLGAVRGFLAPRAHQTAREADAPAGHVLVVDDDRIQLKLARAILGQHHFSVETAGSAAEALARARSRLPAAILCDVLMPGMDGFQLCAAARADARLSQVPVVLVTSHYVESADRQLAREAGAFDLVVRTPGFEGAVQALDQALAQGASPAPSPIPALDSMQRDYLARVAAQLDRQLLLNRGLAHRTSLLGASLSVLGSIAGTLGRRADVQTAMQEVIAQCVDAGGLSRGAIYLRNASGAWRCAAEVGFGEPDHGALDALYGFRGLLELTRGRTTPLVIPVDDAPGLRAEEFLARIGASTAVFAPLPEPSPQPGALLLVTADRELASDEWRGFAQSVAAQIAQALGLSFALASARASEDRYRAEGELLRAALDAAERGVLLVDTNGTVVVASAPAARLFGSSRDELEGQHIDRLLPDWPELSTRALNLAPPAAGRPASQPLRGRHRNGSELRLEASLTHRPDPDPAWLITGLHPAL